MNLFTKETLYHDDKWKPTELLAEVDINQGTGRMIANNEIKF